MKAPDISPKEIKLGDYTLIDVRSNDEFYGELGHVPGSKLITLGEELMEKISAYDKNQKIVFICRSGNRSGTATLMAIEKGFTNVLNMSGGMLLWNELGLGIEK